MNARIAGSAVIVTALLSMAACTSKTPGTSTSVPSSPMTIAPSTSAGSGLAAVQPCDLLDASALSQNSLHSEGPTSGSGARTCRWNNTDYDDGLGYALGVDIRDSQGADTFNNDGFAVSNTTVGNHKALIAKGTTSDVCDITIGVTQTSRVDVSVNTGAADVNQSCTLVKRYAQLIEPKLP